MVGYVTWLTSLTLNTYHLSCFVCLDVSGLQQILVLERPLERRLHLHLPELGDREVEVLDRSDALVRVVLEEELGEMETGEGDLGAEADLGADLKRLVVVVARF